MKTSSAGNFKPRAMKLMAGFVFVAMIGSIDVAPALGKDDRDRGRRDHGRYEERGRGNERGHYAPRRVYRERVYVAPRVIYEPPPPPGISIWFPPIVIHP
jgi:hypothetical protein